MMGSSERDTVWIDLSLPCDLQGPLGLGIPHCTWLSLVPCLEMTFEFIQ